MSHLFDIDAIFFTVLGYPMSYLEFMSVVSGAVAVWLSAQANVWSWPIGTVSVVLFLILFFQIQLYPDVLLQVFFAITNLMGWWAWTHPKPDEAVLKTTGSGQQLKISRTPPASLLTWSAVGVVATVGLGTFAQNLNTWFPLVFSKPSAFPYIDSFTTVMSVVATFLMIRKRVECWYVWLLVDLVLTYVYYIKGVKFVALEYAVFCLIAVMGAINWTREYRGYLAV